MQLFSKLRNKQLPSLIYLFLLTFLLTFFSLAIPKSTYAQSTCGGLTGSNVGPEIAVPTAGTDVVAAQNYSGVVSVINYVNQGFTDATNSVPNKYLNPVITLRVEIDANP